MINILTTESMNILYAQNNPYYLKASIETATINDILQKKQRFC